MTNLTTRTSRVKTPSELADMMGRQGPKKRSRNRYAGMCDHCRDHVATGKGVILKYDGIWHVRCIRCYDETGLRHSDRKGNWQYRQNNFIV